MMIGMVLLCLLGAWIVAQRLVRSQLSSWVVILSAVVTWLALPTSLEAAGGLGFLFPLAAIVPTIQQRLDRMRRRDTFPAFLESLALFLRSGLTLSLALAAMENNLPPPLVLPVHRLRVDLEQSLSMQGPLQRFAEELGFGEARTFAAVVSRQLTTGMSLREVVERLRLEMETTTAQARRRHLASIPYLLGISVGMLLVDTVAVLAYPRVQSILGFLVH